MTKTAISQITVTVHGGQIAHTIYTVDKPSKERAKSLSDATGIPTTIANTHTGEWVCSHPALQVVVDYEEVGG